MSTDNSNVLEVKDLRTYFHTDDGTVKAVDGVTFNLKRGDTLGIVGESGSGKSVTNLSIIRLIPTPPGEIVSGEVNFRGQDLLKISEREVRNIRGRRIAMVFQDPMSSLNPFMKISKQLMEITQLHLGHSKQQAREHAIKMLETVGIPEARDRADSYPHEFSGGMRQRVMIAMALSCKPQILIADEPTTALDVTIQAQILELMKELQRTEGTAIVLITHDLGIVANSCRRVNVMYAGRFVEEANVDDLFSRPQHPYTLGLLRSIPRLDDARARLTPIEGQPPDLVRLPSGCTFHPRCPNALDICPQKYPEWTREPTGKGFTCHNPAGSNVR